MCRFIAYVGPPVELSALMLTPTHSLLQQAQAPKRQLFGINNGDGWGVCWYADGVVHHHRTARPMWQDSALTEIGSHVAGAFLAVVRSATPGLPIGEAHTPPFVRGSQAFALNGAVSGFAEDPDPLRRLASSLEDSPNAGTDSEILFSSVLARMQTGSDAAEALEVTTRSVGRRFPDSRLNLVLHDGEKIAATRWGNSLFVSRGEGVIVASEPLDDEPGWEPVPERSLVEATRAGSKISPMAREGVAR
ncbi:MAG: class II glutamine amidotransferase [Actinomycetota bacterium]